MGAMKEAAIQLESRQAEAIGLGDPGTAYRLGLYEACRLIQEWQEYYLDTSAQEEPLKVLSQTWRTVFDAADYLREVTYDD